MILTFSGNMFNTSSVHHPALRTESVKNIMTFRKIYILYHTYITNLTQYTCIHAHTNAPSLHSLGGTYTHYYMPHETIHMRTKNNMLYEMIGDLHAPYSFVNGLKKYY